MVDPVDEYRITSHAAFEMRRRGIEETVVRGVLAAPEQRPAYPRVRLHWLGQTLGSGRGLEEAIEAVRILDDDRVELHLRGRVASGYEAKLDSLRDQAFSFHVAQQPDSVQIDRDLWILRTVTGPVTAINEPAGPAPLEFLPTRPNPVRNSAMFSFSMPRDGTARLSLFDVTGARVRRAAGTRSVFSMPPRAS